MADEIPGEAILEKEGDTDIQGEDAPEQFYGEAEERISTTATLVSDFCPSEVIPEEAGEGYWECHPQEQEGEYFGGWKYEMQEQQGEGEEEDMEGATLTEKRSLDSEYLKTVLGTPLTYALLDIANKRPTDPIQYLGYFLLKWRWGEENTSEYEQRVKELTAERENYREQMREKERQMMLESAEREEELRRAQRDESSLEDEEYLGEGQQLGVAEG